ncbi:hypothetical protein BC829DRAFT_18742 [Chytridium lagenaria]|nr:hypothetical protein BC829DRAFT_18742 [Chytridium lagenaria]
MCNGDNTFAVCMKGEVSVTQVCAGNSICCTKTNSCDFRARCDGLDIPYTPPDKCYGVLDGFSICSDDLTQVFTCQANAIANGATCPEGQACCRKTSRCEAVGACPDVCVGKFEGQLACLSSNQFTQCANGLAGPAIITCAGGTVCCEAKNGCTWPKECFP